MAGSVRGVHQGQPPPDEAALIEELVGVLKQLIEKSYLTGTTYRDTHAKGHALVHAKFTVHDNLPDELRVGLFSAPKTYEAWVRLSNLSPTPQDDIKADIRALSIKLFHVDGERLWQDEPAAKTLDFILMGSPTFLAPNLPQFLSLEKALLKGGLAVPLFFLTHPSIALTIFTASRKCPNLLQKPYYSQTAYAFGDRPVHYYLRNLTPASADLPAHPTPNFLRDRLKADLSKGDARFEFCVQFQTDPGKMPIENPMVEWKESDSPHRTLATLHILRQTFDSPAQMALCENISFNPWRTRPEHAPLGSINRARLAVYPAISAFRHSRNAVPLSEPPLPSAFRVATAPIKIM